MRNLTGFIVALLACSWTPPAVFGQVNARISGVAKFKGPRVNRLQGIGLVVGLAGTGIDVLNEISGSVMSIFEEGATAAADLGVRTLNTTTLLDDLNFGDGVRRTEGEDDLEIVAKDGSTVAVNLDSASDGPGGH